MEDLAAYYSDTDIRDKIQNRLKEQLLKYADNEIVLVSHSMGTIVAYDVLRDLGREADRLRFSISHLITMESPLGLTAVKGQISHERGQKLRTPTVVNRTWVNFSDPEDIVAIDSHVRDDYEENSSGIRVKDILVNNDYPGNPHKSYGYLRTPEFSKHIVNLV